MMLNFFLLSLGIAGFAIVWRNLLENHSIIKDVLKKRTPYVIWKGLTCGSCFTYWTAFFATVLFAPLGSWSLPQRVSLGIIGDLFHFGISWMALACVSVTIRFGYVYIQERVSELVHKHPHAH